MTMASDTAKAENEVSKNYAFFKKMQPEWEAEHRTEYALLHHQKLIAFFESENDAIHTGVRDYGWGDFSVQPVADQHIDLGYQSNVLF